jgi:hypothetical protein
MKSTDLKSVNPKGSCGFESRHRYSQFSQILGPELRCQAIEASRRLARYGKSLRDAVDFYEIHLKTEASLREIKLEPFVRDFLNAKEEGKSGKKRRKASPGYLGTLRYRLDLAVRLLARLQTERSGIGASD